jgi:nucleoside-diphosphate-sugar epimerase
MILVTGGLGVMGTTLVKGLIQKGNKVRVIDIPNHPNANGLRGTGADVVLGDITRLDTINHAFEGVETIYHLAAVLISYDPAVFEKVNVGGTRNMIEGGIACGAKHFIHVSSISVTYPHQTPYSLSKREAERLVRTQDKMQWTIIRPSLSYNERGGQEFMMFYDYLMKFPVVPFIGDGKAVKNPVHVDDLMKGFLAVPNNPKAFGKLYNFCGSEEISIGDLAKLMLTHKGATKPFVHIPVSVSKVMASLMKVTMKRPPLTWSGIAGLTQNANPDWSQAKEDLDYHPIGITEGMKRCFPIASRAPGTSQARAEV